MVKKKKQMSALTEELDKVLHKLSKNNPSLAQNTKVMIAWEHICPPYFYKYTTGVELRGSKVIIFISSPVIAHDLGAMSEMYKEAINNYIGKQIVSSVSFYVS